MKAEWAQVVVDAVAAAATLFAVAVALWLPSRERRRVAHESGRAVLALSRYTIRLGGRLEAELLLVDPGAYLRELRLLMSIAEKVVLRDDTPASIVAIFMLQLPEMRRIETHLSDWVECIDSGRAYDALPLRQFIQNLLPRLSTLAEVRGFSAVPSPLRGRFDKGRPGRRCWRVPSQSS